MSKQGKSIGVARRVVQVAALLLFLIPPLVAGFGLLGLWQPSAEQVSTPAELPFFGTLASSQVGPVTILDPFAALQVLVASKTFALEWLIGILPVVIVYGLIRARVFCGWVCPVNFLLEGVDWLRQKLHLEVKECPIPRHAKVIAVPVILVLSALLSVPVFEMFSPIGFINRGLVLGSMVGGLTLLAIVLAELFFGHRVWCCSLCPLGGCYEVLGKVGLVNVKIDHDACIGCNKCKKVCLCAPEILDAAVAGDANAVTAGDCMLCGKCLEACPTDALKIAVGK